ncbi:MAG TPA: hypothetical protein VNZ04_14350 [Trinickia sp.]|jgi:hypothetical protein|nr:hypothetical protein [Trinickia sp.]
MVLSASHLYLYLKADVLARYACNGLSSLIAVSFDQGVNLNLV